MKLLFDQNLSYKLIEKIDDLFPDSSHVKLEKLEEEDDLAIQKFAKDHQFTIVTQDSDFYDLAIINGIPPKIIWIRSGNSSTQNIEALLRDHALPIQHFFQDIDRVCLEIF